MLKSSYYYPFQITIDDREPIILEAEFREKGNMIIQRQRMDVGDYLLDEDVLVERKTIPDFCTSIKDGRLFNQVKKLSSSKVPACMILEGRNRQFMETEFNPKAIQGILLSISLAFRMPILRTKNPHESVEVMLQSFKQLSKDKLTSSRFNPRPTMCKKKNHPILAKRIHILEGFPGIGTDRAERLLGRFGNLQEIFAAEEEELLKVPGLGEKTVNLLCELLGRGRKKNGLS